VAYEDGEEEEAVPLEELFHELQARFAEISRDSPRFAGHPRQARPRSRLGRRRRRARNMG